MNDTLAPSLRLQSTIVHALMMQDMMSRYAQGRLGMLLVFLEPILMVVGLYVIRFYLKGELVVHGVPLILFIVTGYMLSHCFRLCIGQVAGATRKKASSRMFPQVTTMDAIVARTISSMIIYAGVLFGTFFLVYLWTGTEPNNVLLVLISSALALVLATPVGIIVGVIERLFPASALFISLLLRVNVFVSGALFLASEVPPFMLKFIMWHPLFHVIEMMREAWFPGYVSPIADPRYVIMVLIPLYAIALSVERMTSRFKFS